MTKLSPVFSIFILLLFPWFKPFDGRYLQSKACIIIERSDPNRICAFENDLFATPTYAVKSGWCALQKSDSYCREVVMGKKGRLEGGGGEGPCQGWKKFIID